MSRLTEVDVDFISLVSKGANKQKINIYKSDDYEPDITQYEDNEEMKGFFNVLKSFFNKETKTINKESTSNIKSFKDRMTAKDVLQNIWSVNDTLVSTIRDIVSSGDIKDKKQALSIATDEHGAYLKAKVEGIDDIKKSDLLNEGDEDMKAEEIAEIIKEAIAPLQTKLDEIEKGENKEVNVESPVQTELSKEDISKAVSDAITPLTERIERIESFKGISKQADGIDETVVNKSNSVFAGIDI